MGILVLNVHQSPISQHHPFPLQKNRFLLTLPKKNHQDLWKCNEASSSINKFIFLFYRDLHPPQQLYANSPSALLYYHSEQMLQPLQNLEVTKTINLIGASGPGFVGGCLAPRGTAQPPPHSSTDRQTDRPGSALPAARDSKFSIAEPPKQPIATTKLKTNWQKSPPNIVKQRWRDQGRWCDLQTCSKDSGKLAARCPRVLQTWHKCGCNYLSLSYFWGGVVSVGACVQTKSLQPQINPTGKGLTFPTELISPAQPSVAPGVINARVYLWPLNKLLFSEGKAVTHISKHN